MDGLSFSESHKVNAELKLPETKVDSASIPETAHGLRAFDGKELYDAAFEALISYHLGLNSGEKSRSWALEWEHKFDKSGALDSEAGTDKAVASMLASLGQRFDYYHNRRAIDEHGKMTGAGLVGIGVRLGLSKKNRDHMITEVSRLVIDDITDGSPADQSGLKAGDIILSVDGKELKNLPLEDAVAKIRGDAEVPVSLKVERSNVDGSKEIFAVAPVRRRVNLQTVWFRELEGGMTYIKLHDFDSGSAKSGMEIALRKAASSRGLVLDLRANPGGNIENAHDITAMMLEDGPFLISRARVDGVVSEKEIDFNKYMEYNYNPRLFENSQTQPAFKRREPTVLPHDLPVVVLVDSETASSAEILSGALQYNRRAIIVGEATTGKGVAQTIVPLPFGRNLHVTSMEFSPGRESNDWVGIIPDEEVAKDNNPAIDSQLWVALEMLEDLARHLEVREQRREEQKKKNEDEFYRNFNDGKVH